MSLLGDVEVLETLETVSDTVTWFKENDDPDLLFLDIQLADGLSFEIFDELDLNIPVIFTTAYDEYAVRAFKLNSIDYLLKPIMEDDLKAALEKHDRLHGQAAPWKELRSLLKVNSKSYRTKLVSKRGDKLIRIDISDVAYFRADGDLLWLINKEGKEYIVDFTLERLETELDPEAFFRISRSMLLASDEIVQAHKYFNGRLKLDIETESRDEIIVSRSRCKEFLDWFGA